ncbi:MAG: mechanosensitive ion channel [Clostridia bacterium]|nr:mechanosensitive ion channel [Clostridia bacterium]
MEDFLKEMWTKISEFAVTYGFRLIASLVVLIIGSKLIKFVVKRVKKSKGLEKMQKTAQVIVVNSLKIFLYAILIVTICSILDIPMASIVGVITSCALAVGLALQGALSNLAGGFMILIFKPFLVDDYIDAGSCAGTVVDIGAFYTTLKTPDNKKVVIPNGALANGVVTNFSRHPTRRVDLKFNVAYSSNIDKVREVILGCANSHDLVLKDPAPVVYLTEQADSALVFSLRAWANNSDYWTVFFELNEAVKRAFDATGIKIPFPQLDVHMDK